MPTRTPGPPTTRYLADTNVYITAANDPAFGQAFAAFVRAHGPLAVSTVVVGEVLFGVADVTRHRAMARAMTDGVRALTPSRADWLAAARAIAALGGDKITKSRSFWNDTLIAAQCARLGLVLITNNPADYRRLQAHLTFAAVLPFPA
jgi:predicted nucleic acid-binding protein